MPAIYTEVCHNLERTVPYVVPTCCAAISRLAVNRYLQFFAAFIPYGHYDFLCSAGLRYEHLRCFKQRYEIESSHWKCHLHTSLWRMEDIHNKDLITSIKVAGIVKNQLVPTSPLQKLSIWTKRKAFIPEKLLHKRLDNQK